MSVSNLEIAERFDTLADLLDIEGANRFRVRAYRNAAEFIRNYTQSLCTLSRNRKDLSKLPSIGKDLALKIRVLCETGQLPLLDVVSKRTPVALSRLLKIRGLGPRRVATLYGKLKIRSTHDLERAARAGQIRTLPGFGATTESKILRELELHKPNAARFLRSTAAAIAAPLLRYLKRIPGVNSAVLAGSFRRCCETVGDLDVLVTARRGSDVIPRFANYDEVIEVLSSGRTQSTVRLRSGMQVDLRVVATASYGAALHYFTGSKAHNIAIRILGRDRGLKINEYGVFKGERKVAGKTETEVFRSVGLRYIEAELREDRGEIQAAERDRLPKLVDLSDIRGDLHSHTNATDGRNSIEELAKAAVRRGYEYIAITDHSRRVRVARGMNRKQLVSQIRKIDALNTRLTDIVLLKSCEIDILANGSLDLPDSIVKELDLAVCAIHYNFNLSRDKQTSRILRAMDNPLMTILAHPTGRLLNERGPYEIDVDRVMRAAADRGVYMELNANPHRLDLSSELCRAAKDHGVKIVISSDAHSTAGLGDMQYGVEQARRAWLESDDIINTANFAELLATLRAR